MRKLDAAYRTSEINVMSAEYVAQELTFQSHTPSSANAFKKHPLMACIFPYQRFFRQIISWEILDFFEEAVYCQEEVVVTCLYFVLECPLEQDVYNLQNVIQLFCKEFKVHNILSLHPFLTISLRKYFVRLRRYFPKTFYLMYELLLQQKKMMN